LVDEDAKGHVPLNLLRIQRRGIAERRLVVQHHRQLIRPAAPWEGIGKASAGTQAISAAEDEHQCHENRDEAPDQSKYTRLTSDAQRPRHAGM
jgi:hypothetical protein